MARYISKRPKKRRFKKLIAFLLIIAILIVGIIGVFPNYFPMSEKLYYKIDYVSTIQEASDTYEVDPYLVTAVIKCESNFEPTATSDAGAIGLMQLMSSTAEDMARWKIVDDSLYSPDNLTDPTTNIYYGTAYLAYLLERYDGDISTAIVAYNAGLGNVDDWLATGQDIEDSIEFSETESYLQSVQEAYDAYQRLYPDIFS